jgi:hypothetical protein
LRFLLLQFDFHDQRQRHHHLRHLNLQFRPKRFRRHHLRNNRLHQ